MLKIVLNSILFILISCILTVYCQDQQSSLKALRGDLLKNYDRYSRPVKQASTTINVTFQFGIQQILDLDMTSQTFHVDGNIILTWKDEFLVWDPSKYNGIKKVMFDFHEIWTPDIIPYNTAAGMSTFASDAHSTLSVDYRGRVFALLPSNIVVSCITDLTDYPFDGQTCYLEFGSWVYNVNELNLTKSKSGRLYYEPYVKNSEWNVDKISGYIFTEYTAFSNVSVARIIINVSRRVDIHFYYILMPYLTASLLGLVVFLVPIGSIYRIVFGSLALFILVNLLLFLAYNIGFHALGVPYAVRCISINIMLITISLVVTNMTYQLIMSLMVTCPPLPSCLAHHLTNPILARIFVLKGNLESTELDEEANVNDFSNQQPFQSTSSRAAIREWALLLRLIDRLLFITYIVVIIIYHS
ncbi:neuronal acetylcholine receptor subunit alpha-7-like [Tetranychus urticae]|uniref:Neurotransmitter-gated ion-channel ligand-binding domain-containing protein n=1 Tax=Tetranychus urticae TaxID=32264 RepID=T1KCH4_TETUR|nr:neuronal acetylcholine receptor subunit alpha-7-like [Tetranychus urticae]